MRYSQMRAVFYVVPEGCTVKKQHWERQLKLLPIKHAPSFNWIAIANCYRMLVNDKPIIITNLIILQPSAIRLSRITGNYWRKKERGNSIASTTIITHKCVDAIAILTRAQVSVPGLTIHIYGNLRQSRRYYLSSTIIVSLFVFLCLCCVCVGGSWEVIGALPGSQKLSTPWYSARLHSSKRH